LEDLKALGRERKESIPGSLFGGPRVDTLHVKEAVQRAHRAGVRARQHDESVTVRIHLAYEKKRDGQKKVRVTRKSIDLTGCRTEGGAHNKIDNLTSTLGVGAGRTVVGSRTALAAQRRALMTA